MRVPILTDGRPRGGGSAKIYARPGYLDSPSKRHAGRMQAWRIFGSYGVHMAVTALMLVPVVVPKLEIPKEHVQIVFQSVRPEPPKKRPAQEKTEPALINPLDTTPDPPKEPPKVDEKEIKVDDVALDFRDPSNQMESVVTRLEGMIAFGDPNEKDVDGMPFVRYVIRAANWEQVSVPGGKTSLNGSSAYEIRTPYAIVQRLRSRFGVPANYTAYLMLPVEFDGNLNIRIRQFAAGKGMAGTVTLAVVQFSMDDPIVGVKVTQVSVTPSGDR